MGDERRDDDEAFLIVLSFALGISSAVFTCRRV